MELRAPRDTDAAAVLDLIVARDVADLGRPDYTLEDVENDWASPSVAGGTVISAAPRSSSSA